jgi:hypothetical protein
VADVAHAASFVSEYPDGFEQADFTSSYASETGQVAINSNDVYFEDEGHVSFTYGASTISVRNDTGLTWLAGSRIQVQAAYAEATGGGGGAPVVLPDDLLVLAEGEAPEDGDLAIFGAETTELKEGPAMVEEVLGDPADIALGTSSTLATDIATDQFWRMRQVVSQASPLTLTLMGSSVTPGAANNTLNVRVTGITAAVPWQIAGIADGLEDVEGKITFVNGEGNTNNCFPQNHATAGATVRYQDDISQSDLVVPTGAGSELTVYYTIKTTGAAGVFQISGYEKFTA